MRGFDLAAGDGVVVTPPELLLDDGRLDGDRVLALDAGGGLALRADMDGDGSFEHLLARLVRAAGLAADDVLLNAIA